MKVLLKTILYISLFAVAFLTAFYLPPYFDKFVNESLEKIETRGQARIETSKAKISAPVQESEFEKTAQYGKLNCQNYENNTLVSGIFERINTDRELNNKKALSWSNLLCQSANLKAENMIENSYFEHVSPSGVTPWYWIDRVEYKYTFSGENLALNYYTSESAHIALMNSPGHKANILNENFTQIGLAYFRGKINNQDAFVIVQHFASPAPEVPPVKYVCETKKAEKNLKDLERDKKKIDNYLKDAEDIKDQIKAAGGDTDEVNDYIDDMEDKKKRVKKYIREIEDYLDECKKLNASN
ncbi:cysteine-rich secretory protein family protein [bacterium BMS3Abin15]|nr:cysteine-rich secretory protein family protein [bacterium BMS3Abin15]HDZ85710.1 hypothetical protein [Candidatus Moranbacteria bacterium]